MRHVLYWNLTETQVDGAVLYIHGQDEGWSFIFWNDHNVPEGQ